ncbi:MAG: chemotaxis protein methyltransferase CheR, partial [Rhizobacter sp.]|nr:chemotaxis protein methyltransferase CheR [Rhizobacter sp.]
MSTPREPPEPPSRWMPLRWPAASLRAYLVMVILVATVPLALFSLHLIQDQVDGDRDDLEQSLRLSSANLSMSIDREIRSSADALTMLSYNEALQIGDVQRFHDRLDRLPNPRPMWNEIYLSSPDGRMVLNSRAPFGTKLGQEVSVAPPVPLPLPPSPSTTAALVDGGAATTTADA